MFDQVIGNIPGAQNPNDPVPGVETCAVVVTRAQAWKNASIKPLAAKDVTAQTAITKDELVKMQQRDTATEKYVDLEMLCHVMF